MNFFYDSPEEYLSSASANLSSANIPDTLNVERVPSYLLELKFGEKLYAELLQAMTSSNLTLPGLIKSREAFKKKLATFGILGKSPGQFFADDAYSDELLNIFRSRVIPTSSSSASSSANTENHIEDAELLASSEKLLDKAPTRLISEQLAYELEDEDGEFVRNGGARFKFPLPSTWSVLITSSFKPLTEKLILTTPRDDSRANSSGFSAASPSNLSYKPSLAWANKDVPVHCTIYYYEITILDGLPTSDVSVGFLYENIDKYLNQMPGLDIRSFGYNGKEGKIYSKSDNLNENFGAKFGVNDVIGCGINRYTETIFYTKNGILLGDAFHNIKKKSLYPCIGMGDFISVKTNFGLRNEDGNFLFDIDNYVKGFKNTVHKKIESSMAAVDNDKSNNIKKKNELKDEDIPDVLNSFVLSYLDHSGFGKSWSALSKDLKTQEAAFNNFEIDDVEEDEIDTQLAQRETIRNLIINDEIDVLISYLKKHFRSLFDSNIEAIFKLKCLKLINMIKFATSEKDNTRLLKAVEYGKVLKEEYKDSKTRVEYLNDISSLVAFEDPASSKFGFLLRDMEVHKHFEDLNKLILMKSGKDEFSIFERILNQIEVVLAQLVDKGDNEAMLINLERDYL